MILKMLICGIMLFLFSMMTMMMSLYLMFINKCFFLEWLIYSINSMKFNFYLLIDYKSLMFIFLVSNIFSMIIIYSISYMNLSDIMMNRFFYLMILFLASMYLLILSPNMLSIILGWDGLGLISYCLVIYYMKMKSFSSGMVTIILNRIGDSGLLMMMCFMTSFGSWNLILYNMDNIMMFFLLMMAFTKSAQMPFSTWLPMAMMAPTPVSSLVHSSTLVTAGIYLLIRYIDLFNIEFKNIILLISSLTMLFAGLVANFELDLKKIVAYSTLSQLGFMMSMISLSFNELVFLHLFIHAMFKSLMFMCVGSFMHYMNSIQDLRMYYGMFYIYPMKSMILMFSMMSLCGFPFLVGFYSKDLIIEFFLYSSMNYFSMINLILSTMLTISYTFRMILVLTSNFLMLNMIFSKEDDIMSMSMLIMMILSIIYSKLMFNLMNFNMFSLNLMLIYKMMVLKMILLGMIMGFNFYKYIQLNNKIGLFFSMFMNMNFIYKKIYLNSLMFMFKYEIEFEKIFIEMFSGKFMSLLLNLYNIKIKNLMINILLLIMIYFILLMIILIN
uniref:NADH:ubiquinone reductase (H(+)-translocating) n=1 Tax=Apis andreniformis TaxID=7464 RepID=A0A067YHX2_9HYME|nr:NADH dehydrogenase subunit 5 [Apis andreniformis]AHC32072.1 NADH dehydrogenase subunit 5 [Apis andreniformis]